MRAFCRLVGANDLHGWLGISPETPHREALVHLERRRRQLEAELHDPEQADLIERFLDIYDLLQQSLKAPETPPRSLDTPDYYAILGVQPVASYAEIEHAWQRLRTGGVGNDALISQAWRVLGDPLNRANYDRSRSEVARRRSTEEPSFEPDPFTADAPLLAEPASVDLPGPQIREVALDRSGAQVTSVPVVVSGSMRLHARVEVDHPAMDVSPGPVLDLAPGRHALRVSFDAARIHQLPLTCSLTLSNGDLHQVVTFRVARRGPRLRMRIHQEPVLFALAAIGLLSIGWWLGSMDRIERHAPHAPSSIGRIDQLPGTSSCFESSPAPLPGHVDVHTDGLGRPTGFSFGGGVASPAVETCVRTALRQLDFPPTKDGMPAFHRYLLPSDEASP